MCTGLIAKYCAHVHNTFQMHNGQLTCNLHCARWASGVSKHESMSQFNHRQNSLKAVKCTHLRYMRGVYKLQLATMEELMVSSLESRHAVHSTVSTIKDHPM